MKTTLVWIGVAVVALAALGAVAFFHRTVQAPAPTPTSTSTPETQTTATTTPAPAATGGTAGAHCGGFIRNAPTCAAGFHCVLNVSRPDTGGVCVADGAGTANGASGVNGTVLLGPTCPVMRNPPDPQCADKPYATTVIARSSSGAVVASTKSTSDGTFTLALPAGSYTLSATGGATLPRCADVSVIVPKSGYATALISCDTGIR